MNGVILVNKDKYCTSRDMVDQLNHIFDMKKIGHTGTLDPIATGILVMCLGKYTKLVNLLSSYTKEYIATIKIGIKTDTFDIEGNVLETKNCTVNIDDIKKVFKSLIGKQIQTVPKYSAKKINGKKLYEYARNNEEVILPTNGIEIYELELLDFDNECIKFKCNVSKGTYIRSLIQDICNKLNIIGTMSSLTRTKQGIFSINDSYTIDDIKKGNYKLLTAKDLFDYPVYYLNDEEYFKVKNGSKMNIKNDENYVIMVYQEKEIAIYKKDENMFRIEALLI